MPPVEAELHRRDPSDLLIPWRLNADGTDPVADEDARARLVEIEFTLAARFGAVVEGEPQTISVVGPTDIAIPDSGSRVRLKWISLHAGADNTGEVFASVHWSGATPGGYVVPLGPQSVFAHGTVREALVDEKLQLTLSHNGRPVSVNLDWEPF